VIHRRAFLGATAALTAVPCFASGNETSARMVLTGSLQQGSLVVGKIAAGSHVSLDGKRLSIGPDGYFTFGFQYDQKDPAVLTARYADGSSETRNIAPVVRQYEVQAINGLPEKYVSPPPDVQQRIQREHALVAQARTKDTDAEWFAEPFDWPAHGIISGLFGSQRILNGTPSAPHFGVDVAAGEGGEIRAPTNAVVALAEQFYLEGGYTMLDHGHGVFTGYLHQSKQLVKRGDVVKRGQLIGLVGHTGRATGPHLHWAMNWFQVRLDPSRSTRTPTASRV
jgi:murein DD-endopeptidase MepM/ murein hydrolase activator NlpD